jgi:hypothetical protein
LKAAPLLDFDVLLARATRGRNAALSDRRLHSGRLTQLAAHAKVRKSTPCAGILLTQTSRSPLQPALTLISKATTVGPEISNLRLLAAAGVTMPPAKTETTA